jgi:hypothetical protein
MQTKQVFIQAGNTQQQKKVTQVTTAGLMGCTMARMLVCPRNIAEGLRNCDYPGVLVVLRNTILG